MRQNAVERANVSLHTCLDLGGPHPHAVRDEIEFLFRHGHSGRKAMVRSATCAAIADANVLPMTILAFMSEKSLAVGPVRAFGESPGA